MSLSSFQISRLAVRLSAFTGLSLLFLFTGCRNLAEERFPADARINGQPVHFAFDTGSECTLVIAQTARRLGVKFSKPRSSANPAPGKVATGKTECCRFTVGKETCSLRLLTYRPPWWVPWDLDGCIGWPDIKDEFVAIDARADALKRVDHLPQDTNGWVVLPLYRRTGVLALELPRTDGKTGVVEVDTGNPEGVSLSPGRWKEWRATHPHARSKLRIGFMPGSGLGIGRTYQADDLRLGPLTWNDVPVRKATRTEMAIAGDDAVLEASLGITALRQWNVIIDRKSHLAFWHPRPDPISTSRSSGNHEPELAADTNSTVGLRLREHELMDRATDALEAQKCDDALTNLTELIALEPDNASALALRGDVVFSLHAAEGSATNLDQALKDLDLALELDPTIVPAYFARGTIHYFAGRWTDAVRDYQRICELSPQEANYPRFYIWVVRARNCEQPAADRELGTYFGPGKRPKGDAWQKKIAAFLLGRLDEPRFLAAALRSASGHDAGRQCEAWFYAGVKRRLSGDIDTARAYFQRSLATGQKGYDEYNFAAAELRMSN